MEISRQYKDQRSGRSLDTANEIRAVQFCLLGGLSCLVIGTVFDKIQWSNYADNSSQTRENSADYEEFKEQFGWVRWNISEGVSDAFPVAFANGVVYANDTRDTIAFYEEIRGFYA